MTDLSKKLIERLQGHYASPHHGGCQDCYGLVMDDAAAEIARLTAERDDALALAAKLNGGEELQSLMSLNNRLAAELAGLRIERDALKGEVSDVCEIANNVKAALSRAREALNPFVDFSNRFGDTARDDSWQITQNPSGKGNLTMGDCRNARAALLSISEPVK